MCACSLSISLPDCFSQMNRPKASIIMKGVALPWVGFLLLCMYRVIGFLIPTNVILLLAGVCAIYSLFLIILTIYFEHQANKSIDEGSRLRGDLNSKEKQ
jgi:hypothetical protein